MLGSVFFSWTAPLNPQFDITGYRVNVCVNGNCTSETIASNTLSSQEGVKPGDMFCVNVSTVTACDNQVGGVSEPTNSCILTKRDNPSEYICPT